MLFLRSLLTIGLAVARSCLFFERVFGKQRWSFDFYRRSDGVWRFVQKERFRSQEMDGFALTRARWVHGMMMKMRDDHTGRLVVGHRCLMNDTGLQHAP